MVNSSRIIFVLWNLRLSTDADPVCSGNHEIDAKEEPQPHLARKG